MLTFFPQLYPDELLYSIVARYHKMSGNIQIRHTKQELFDSPNVNSFILVPDRFNILTEKVKKYNITQRQLLYEHTLLPYIICFCREERDGKTPCYLDPSKDVYRTYTADTVYHTLRYCPECIKADKDKFGESYWHRNHQIKGNRVCHKHGCCLEDSNIISSGYKEFIALEDITFEKNTDLSIEYRDNYWRLAKDIDWTMNHYFEISEKYKNDLEYYEKRNTAFLKKKGLVTTKGRIYQDKLIDQFRDFIIEQYGLNFYNQDEYKYKWVSNICRKGKETAITMRRILIAEFLAADIQKYFTFEFKEVDKSRIQYDKPNGYETKVISYRSRWLKLLESNQYEKNIDMVKADQAAYLWLTRNDNEWLKDHLLEKIKPGGNCTYTDWEKEDDKLVGQIPEIIKQVLCEEGKPIKLTYSLIEKKLGSNKGYLSKNRLKLSKTIALAETYIEDTEMFQKRRIDWVIKNAALNNEKIPLWILLRRAGIRTKYYEKSLQYINNKYSYIK